ncbi:MAG: alpha/beta hydrolase [Ilumatobacteraceae bacterium]
MTDASVLFVHGSFFSSWTWIPLMERLAARGVDSHTVDLPFTSLADDVLVVQDKIAELRVRGNVSVVCHSYTGITVAAAAHNAQHLVFIAARMPAVGESQAAISPQWGNPDFRTCINFGADGTLSLEDGATEFLFHRSPNSLARLAMANRRSMKSEIPIEPMENPAWITVPSSYVVCTDDRAVRLEQQRMRAGWAKHSIEIDCDHSPFFSAPDETASFIFETHMEETK